MLLDLFLIGLAITLEPLQNIAMILILGAERGTFKGLGFLFGWIGIVADHRGGGRADPRRQAPQAQYLTINGCSPR